MTSTDSAARWAVRGEYMEACSCDFLCPCITKNGTTPATEDFCKVAMAFRVDEGHYDDLDLAGVAFIAVSESPPIMTDGDWKLGLIVDEDASDEQVSAIAAIASGQAGGPMAPFADLVGEFRGIERAPVVFEVDGDKRRVKAGDLLEQFVEGVGSVSAEGGCIAIDNTFHPANKRLNLATALRNVIDCFGISWRDTGSDRNGHFAPFDWQS